MRQDKLFKKLLYFLNRTVVKALPSKLKPTKR